MSAKPVRTRIATAPLRSALSKKIQIGKITRVDKLSEESSTGIVRYNKLNDVDVESTTVNKSAVMNKAKIPVSKIPVGKITTAKTPVSKTPVSKMPVKRNAKTAVKPMVVEDEVEDVENDVDNEDNDAEDTVEDTEEEDNEDNVNVNINNSSSSNNSSNVNNLKNAHSTDNLKDTDSDIEIEFEESTDVQKESDASDASSNAGDASETDVLIPTKAPAKKNAREEHELDMALLSSVHEADEDIPAIQPIQPIKKALAPRNKLKNAPVPSETEEDGNAIPEPKARKARKKTATAKPTESRGPGRPRKTPKKEPIARKGISKTATNPDDHIEVLYDQPILLRKIFQIFKSLAANQIQIIFRPKDIILYAMDHHKNSKIRARIDATKINHYYCKSTLDIGVASKELEQILNKVDKEYSSVVLLSAVGSTQRSITLVLENDIQIDEIHTIDLIGQYDKMENEHEFNDEDYTIKFQLPSKYFKKTINDIKTMSSQLSITQEDSDSPLVFEYLTNNKKIQSKHTVKDGNKIKLQSDLAAGDSFRIDVKIDHIKPISATQIADEILILVDENKAFMTKAYIDDGAIEIKTLTDIIDERPGDDEDLDD